MTHRTPGLWRFLFGLSVAAVLVIGLAATTVGEQEVVTRWSSPVMVEVQEPEILAGRELNVVVFADAPDGTVAELALFGTLNSTLFVEPFVDGQAAFTISGVYTRHRGAVTIVAEVLRNSSAPLNIRVLPRPAVEPVVPLVGPRTIIADGTDLTMTAASPADEFGNAVPNSTDVATSLTRTDGTIEAHTDPVVGGIASRVVTATTETGRVIVSSSVGDVGGPSNVFDQVAGAPVGFQVEIDARNAVADGFNLREVRTTELRDRFGNVLPDGIAAVFTIESATGSTFVNATVQGGIARTRIKAPAKAGTVVVRALISGVRSEPTSLDFDAAIRELPVQASTSDGWTMLTVGPIESALGGYVPDGTLVSIYGPSGDQVSPLITAEVRGGSAQVRLPEADAPFEVEVLGLRTRLPQPLGSE